MLKRGRITLCFCSLASLTKVCQRKAKTETSVNRNSNKLRDTPNWRMQRTINTTINGRIDKEWYRMLRWLKEKDQEYFKRDNNNNNNKKWFVPFSCAWVFRFHRFLDDFWIYSSIVFLSVCRAVSFHCIPFWALVGFPFICLHFCFVVLEHFLGHYFTHVMRICEYQTDISVNGVIY